MAQLAETSLAAAEIEHRRIDEFGRDIHQREWTRLYQNVDEYDSDGDLMPSDEFSVSDKQDLEDRDNLIDEIDENSDSESDDEEHRQMLEAGFEPCSHRRDQVAGDDGGSIDRHCALREPTTRVDPRDEFLERSLGSAKVALLRELGVYDSLIQAMPQVPSCNILTSEEDPAVMAMEDYVEIDILLTLDSGCCDHIVDMSATWT